MPENIELPSHIKTWEQTNPKAFELYKGEFYVDRKAKLSAIQGIVEPIAQKAANNMNSHPQDIWKTFRQAAQELENSNDSNQILALYDAIYGKLNSSEKKKLAYYMAY
ncbi:MAG: hypothetical protein KAR85_01235 [Methanosarcinales archaeon]|nr:hypothetical protein [Methanosarcinales archaeon]